MFERVCLVHYHEIGLKGRNRAQFERRLQRTSERRSLAFPCPSIERIASRVAVRVTEPDASRAVAERIALIPGVQSVSLAYRVPRTPSEIEDAALLALREAGAFTHVPGRVAPLQHRLPGAEHGDQPAHRRVPPGARPARASTCRQPDVTVRIDVVQGERLRFVARDRRAPAACRSACRAGWSRCSRRASTRRWRRGA